MALQERIHHLDAKHHALEDQIKRELKHPGSDDLEIADLKKKKLALKDEITSLKRNH